MTSEQRACLLQACVGVWHSSKSSKQDEEKQMAKAKDLEMNTESTLKKTTIESTTSWSEGTENWTDNDKRTIGWFWLYSGISGRGLKCLNTKA